MSKVPNPAEESARDPRGTPRAAGDFSRTILGQPRTQQPRSATDDLLKLRFNPDLVAAERLDQNQADRLRGHVGRHEEFTGSELATRLLDRWEETVEQFWRIAPKANVARLEEEHEGTVTAP